MTINAQKYKIVFRRGRPLTKAVLLIMIVLCTVALVVIHSSIRREQDRIAASRRDILNHQWLNRSIQKRIHQLGSHESIIEIAGEELGLYDPETIIIETE